MQGVDDIELLQIQEFTSWRAIRFQNENAALFPIQRGTVIPLDKDTFLVWTHGSVQHDELAGRKLNYYKKRKGNTCSIIGETIYGENLLQKNW